MKIGIISKEAHAKSHAAMLEDRGHEVVMLGGGATSFPSSLDVIVCRLVSCSHTASKFANQARREGRTVLFEESVSGLKKAIEELEAVAAGVKKESTKPVKGMFYRAYFDGRYWSIKTTAKGGRPWRKHHSSVKGGRAEAEKQVAALDAAWMEGSDPDGGSDIGPMDVAGDYNHEPTEAQKPKAKAETGKKTYEELQQDLTELMVMLEETMTKLGRNRYQTGAVEVKLLKRHLFTPGGVACGSPGGPLTKKLDEVTCETCKTSKVFATAQWVLENLS